MEKQSQNNGQRRRRNNRSGGGNRNRSNNRGGQNRNQNSNNRNRNRNRSGGGSRRRRQPKPTAWQKFLSVITFGLLGKPKSGGGRKKKRTPRPEAQTSRPVRNNALKDSPAPERKKRNRTEVTSGRLYVGNLSYETSEVELEELFRGIGNVLSAEVVTNARTQQSKGFAFVEMGSIDEATRAVEVLDDKDFMGRKLIISGARSEGPREEPNENSGEISTDESSATEPELAEAGNEQDN
ncbi:MAG: RNA-binding protein [Verrucomicrobiales bacterium]|nr:RNA-binding protein [Verrucomicrobiales bacterium]